MGVCVLFVNVCVLFYVVCPYLGLIKMHSFLVWRDTWSLWESGLWATRARGSSRGRQDELQGNTVTHFRTKRTFNLAVVR